MAFWDTSWATEEATAPDTALVMATAGVLAMAQAGAPAGVQDSGAVLVVGGRQDGAAHQVLVVAALVLAQLLVSNEMLKLFCKIALYSLER